MLSYQRDGEACAKGDVRASPFRCRSWRCRRCSWQVAREDYRRVEHATLSRPWWLYVVLTFDPSAWGSTWEAYNGAARLWDKRLRRRLERSYGRLDYLQTWERTRRDWPHVNLLLRSDALEEAVKAMPARRRWIEEGDHGRGRLAHWTAWRRWIAAVAPACGFGRRVWVEIVDSNEAVAAYLVKVAEEFSRSAFKVGDQRPLGAPPHFRRLRASRGLLGERCRPVWVEQTDPRTREIVGELRPRPISARGGAWTAILANVAPETFADREPTWTDVADARGFQYHAAKRRAGRPVAPATFEI